MRPRIGEPKEGVGGQREIVGRAEKRGAGLEGVPREGQTATH